MNLIYITYSRSPLAANIVSATFLSLSCNLFFITTTLCKYGDFRDSAGFVFLFSLIFSKSSWPSSPSLIFFSVWGTLSFRAIVLKELSGVALRGVEKPSSTASNFNFYSADGGAYDIGVIIFGDSLFCGEEFLCFCDVFFNAKASAWILLQRLSSLVLLNVSEDVCKNGVFLSNSSNNCSKSFFSSYKTKGKDLFSNCSVLNIGNSGLCNCFICSSVS